MILALINHCSHYIAETIIEIAEEAINDGHYTDMQEFSEYLGLGGIDFYLINDKLKVSCKMQQPIFTIN